MTHNKTLMARKRATPDGETKRAFLDLAQFKQVEEGDGGFTGIASPFGKLDDVDDIAVKGAYRDTIAEFLRDGWLAPDHEWGVQEDLGFFTEAAEEEKGLVVTALFHSTDDAQRIRTKVRTRLEANKSVKLSIGYVVLESKRVTGREAVKYLIDPTPEEIAYCQSRPFVRILLKLKLYEVSLVSVPAARQADVINAKSANAMAATKDRAGAQSTTEGKGVLGDWVEQNMTCRAIGAVMDAIWYVIYDCIYPWPKDTAPPIEERLETLMQAFDEAKVLVHDVIVAILSDESEETQEEAVKALQALGIEPPIEMKDGKRILTKATTDGAPPAGVPLNIHSDRVLAAVSGLKSRYTAIRDLRLKEGRQFSDANKQRLKAHGEAMLECGKDILDMIGEGDEEKSGASATTDALASPEMQRYLRFKYAHAIEGVTSDA